MARKILFTSQKGGVGKSVLARSLAVALAESGRRVLLADADAEQGTCLRWKAQRAARGLKPEIEAAAFKNPEKIDRVKARGDIIIDTPGKMDKASLFLAERADAIFLPSSYSLDDITPTLRIVDKLRACKADPTRIAIVFCRTGGSTAQAMQARSILKMNGLTALEAVMPQRDGFGPLYATGRVGRESPNPYLASAANRVDRGMIDFIEAAGQPQSIAV